MKKKLLFILVFILSAVMLPELIHNIKTENSYDNVICTVKIPELNNEVLTALTDNSVRYVKYLTLDDSLITDPSNSKSISELSDFGYRFGISMNLSPKSNEYYSDLEDIIHKYDISMFYFEESNKDFNNETFKRVADMSRTKGISIGLLENSLQNGLQYGDTLPFKTLDGISDRAMLLNHSDIKGVTEEELKYRLLRSVVDRGIRYITLEAPDTKTLISYDNVYRTFFEELSKKGYGSNEGTVVKTGDDGILKALSVALFSVYMMVVLLLNFNIDRKFVKYYAALFLIAIFSMLYFAYDSAMLLIAFSITVSVPASVSIYLYRHSAEINTTSLIMKYHILSFLTYIFSGCFIWLALSGFDFRIGFITYKLAIPSYILPLFLVLWYVLKDRGLDLMDIKKAFYNRSTVVLTLLTILAVYIYISRSGNYSLIPASYPELKFRILLEDIVAARPRLKEFLIGYPCFFLFLRMDKSKFRILPVYLLLGSSIVGISVLNTFCHSFTPVTISLIRAFTGFVLGTFTAAASCFFLKFLSKSVLQLRLRYSLSDSRNR